MFIKELIKAFLGSNFAYQLWYIPMYIFVIVIYPCIYKYIYNDILRALILGIVSILIILSGLGYPFKFIYYLFFFDLGMLVSKFKFTNILKLKKLLPFLVIFVLLGLNITNEKINIIYKSLIINPFMVLFWYSISLKIKENFIIKLLGVNSFYIFILHEPIINTKISQIFLMMNLYNSIFMQFIISLIVVLSCFCLIFLMKKFKLIERMIF